ncbi:MAG: bifunctional hydroxymethylpyrimidine kinase/phosphomethylpyrimidine kinase [Acetobacteraceae bacterium]|nr:bifunctional hydroxymethylpyrimidine kinase/phosphomethylpyrimidine kinase [Acetobacteraceae bacterium]
MKGRVLICAGSDSGGGAGIQADIKAVTAMGGFAMTAITALTAQNTVGVHGVVGVEPWFIRRQMRVVLDDLGADAIKTGMLADSATIEAVCAELPRDVPLVADPVMVAKGGHRLLDPSATETLKRVLLPFCTVLTPNLPEAEVLSGMTIRTEDDMHRAAEVMLTLGVPAVLLKGGHLDGERLVDLLATPDGTTRWEDARVATRHTHGTGCTLASSIAAGLAQGMALEAAVARARRYVRAAMLSAPGYGAGHGPLDHTVTLDPARL